MKLVYINKVGQNWKGSFIYEFLFSDILKDIDGEGWEAFVGPVAPSETSSDLEQHMVVDSHGNYLTVFHSRDGGNEYINFSRYIIGSGWESKKLLSTGNHESVYDAKIAVGPSGNVVSIWGQETYDLEDSADYTYKTWGIVF